MADHYPWGAQAPQARLAKLQNSLSSSERARDKYLETYKAKIAQFDEAEKLIKADIRQCQQVLEKERSEANASTLTRLIMRHFSNAPPELVEEALKDGSLETRLAALSTELVSNEADKGKGTSKSDTKAVSTDLETDGANETVLGG